MNRLAIAAALSLTTWGISADVAADAPPLTSVSVAFETPYYPGRAPTVKDPSYARMQRLERRLWNQGGRDTAWHPAPRIVVDVLRVRGRRAKRLRVQAGLRSRGYWPFRHCYEDALRKDQQLAGALRLDFVLKTNGRISSIRTSPDSTLRKRTELTKCITRAAKRLKLPRPVGKTHVNMKLTLRTGDAPVPLPVPQQATHAVGTFNDLPALQARVATLLNVPARRCFRTGANSVPGLWGRMALLTQIAPDGRVISAQQTESLFPSPTTTKCVLEALSKITLPRPRRGPAFVVIPIRFGTPPTDRKAGTSTQANE